MNLLTEWQKPSGMRVELNDEEATVEMARKLGWVPFADTEEGLAEAKEILAEKERRAEETVNAAEQNQSALKPVEVKRKPGRPAKDAA